MGDPFAGSDAARNELAFVSNRLRDDHGLDSEQAAAAEAIVKKAAAVMAHDASRATKILDLTDKVAGFFTNPKSLLSLLGL